LGVAFQLSPSSTTSPLRVSSAASPTSEAIIACCSLASLSSLLGFLASFLAAFLAAFAAFF